MLSLINFLIVGDETMATFNHQWFGKNEPTDVIAFPMKENEKVEMSNEKRPPLLGEVVINREQVERNAQEYGVSFEEEMARVAAHGVLHLLGYEDKTEEGKRAMAVIEDKIINEVKI